LGVVAELDADLLEDRVGIGLDQRDAFLVQHLVERDFPLDIGKLRAGAASAAGRASCRGTAALPASPPSARGLLLDSQIVFHDGFPESLRAQIAPFRRIVVAHSGKSGPPAPARVAKSTEKPAVWRQACAVVFPSWRVANQLRKGDRRGL